MTWLIDSMTQARLTLSEATGKVSGRSQPKTTDSSPTTAVPVKEVALTCSPLYSYAFLKRLADIADVPRTMMLRTPLLVTKRNQMYNGNHR